LATGPDQRGLEILLREAVVHHTDEDRVYRCRVDARMRKCVAYNRLDQRLGRGAVELADPSMAPAYDLGLIHPILHFRCSVPRRPTARHWPAGVISRFPKRAG